MIVYKFGGASVKDASGIRNLAEIVRKEREPLVIVVSAFGKTTNALEAVFRRWHATGEYPHNEVGALLNYHIEVTRELLGDQSGTGECLKSSFDSMVLKLKECRRGDHDHDYDMIVSMGEVWSTIVVEGYLNSLGMSSKWVDISKLLVTDTRHRDANILWEESCRRISGRFTFEDAAIYVTQGFIGATPGGEATTLGREGSDYTAAVLGNMLDAVKVVVWKDVPGIMSADPKWIQSATTLPEISYNEAVEMTFSGAKVIHPKTIKPLHNKGIPMHVRSFIDHDSRGTLISGDPSAGPLCPVYVRKEGQILVSILPRDLSFVMGENLSAVFHLFSGHGVKVNLVQAGAVSINICADHEEPKITGVLDELKKEYTILFNEGVEMLTVRHYDKSSFKSVTAGMEVLISQTTRTTIRIVARRIS